MPAPLMTIRIIPKVLQTGKSNIVKAFLFQNRSAKHVEGRYKMASLVKHLNIALGVHTLLAYHGLIVLLGTAALAKEEFRRLRSGPGDIDYRLGVGRKHLENRTAFDSEEQVKQLADARYAQLTTPETATELAGLRPQLIEAETEAVQLLFRAYERAQIVSAAFNEAANMDSDKAHEHLMTAFAHTRSHLEPIDALQVVLFADIDPAELWLQYGNGWGPTFEFARFVGRVNAGVEATLNTEQLALAKKIIDPQCEEAGLSDQWTDLREMVHRHFSIERFQLAIHIAEVTNGIVRVSRSTRDLSVETPMGMRHVITDA